MVFTLLTCGILLALDTLYGLWYFEFSYYYEIKRRFIKLNKDLPVQYRQNLLNELSEDNGYLRDFVQILYFPWAILCFFTPVWYLPVIISFVIALPDLFWKKAYIPPLTLLINLLIVLSCFVYSIVYLLT